MGSRRRFLFGAGMALGMRGVGAAERAAGGVPVVHVTDLYRPHEDPDDHWDLASLFALAHGGDVDLRGVMIDYPPKGKAKDPDVMAVAQMNYLTGKAVPVWTGAPAGAQGAALSGARSLHEVLRGSKRRVVIHVVGSSRDVAAAAKMEPRLFAEKCAGVYLNAGSGTQDRAKAADLEYNVKLDPASYAAMFELPCPLYWMPCFEHAKGPFRVGQWGTYYSFRHADVLPALSQRVQNYFLMMYRHGQAAKKGEVESAGAWNWLRGMDAPVDAGQVAALGPTLRAMWCTAGFLHTAGKTVTREGEIVALGATKEPVFTFDPIRVKCGANGVTEWEADAKARQRWIFHVRDAERYGAAMAAALRWLLKRLP
ncbi:MAG: hypothetical protein HY821_02685 [Acidobacteria bacterium]|nr:hypothetical protein [Acidobacteriota bacterium]